jgi:hypothetical protein
MTPKTAAKMMQECADLTRAETKANQFLGEAADKRAALYAAKRAALEAAGGLAIDMTMRDEFAGQALAGIASVAMHNDRAINPPEMAKAAYDFADAMLEARKTTGEGE